MPRRRIEYRGVVVEEMDTDAVLARQPTVALVDELAHTNVPGSARAKRWQDVEVIRDAGIHVVSTLNIQHLESVADAVATITGAPVNERLPDEVLLSADEIELVDMSPHALRQRMKHGNVYPPERPQVALEQFFTEANLTALRELALRLVARRVEGQLEGRSPAGSCRWSPIGCIVSRRRQPGLLRAVRRAAHARGRAPRAGSWPSWSRRRTRSASRSTAAATSRRRSTTPSTSAPRWSGSRRPSRRGLETVARARRATHLVLPLHDDLGR